LYGRRRCGKSRLLQQTLMRRRSVYFVADEREQCLQRAALAAAISEVVPGFDQVTYPDWASLFERWWREAPAGAIMALDEFPYLVKSSPQLPSVLQRLIDQNRSRPIHTVLSGSSQRMMLGLVLDATAPLYGRAREIIHVKALAAGWIGRALGLTSAADMVEAYSIWGGVPRYWELATEFTSTREAMKHLALDPLGVLYNEPRRLLLDDAVATAQPTSILSLIGQGAHRLSEIAARLEKPATSLTRPLHRLLELGLIRREQPFGASQRTGKKTLYRIADPFLLFWFRFVEPNRSRLEAGQLTAIARDVQNNLRRHTGEVWEELARQSVAHLPIGGESWQPAKRWWGAGTDRKPLELDLVAESADRSALLVGEVKLSASARELDRIKGELRAKSERLPFAKSYGRVHTRVYVIGKKGFRSNVVTSAAHVLRALK